MSCYVLYVQWERHQIHFKDEVIEGRIKNARGMATGKVLHTLKAISQLQKQTNTSQLLYNVLTTTEQKLKLLPQHLTTTINISRLCCYELHLVKLMKMYSIEILMD